ncbi:hypothetical protein [Synechococcus sp. BIOS-E4-1]|uniref:hypothetical protein n=1 Tax=Synechococcus sp. BIOS-E4-1 TaxID=1400864 RepID=UPI001CA455D1|nr:hypothetical protein [Synechococcus sp. BIOS-E4-1]
MSQYQEKVFKRNEREAFNEKVAERRRMMAGLPQGMNNGFTRDIGDAVVDARGAVRNINTPAAIALGAGGAAAGIAGLNAYYQQNAEGLPNDGYNVAGRAVNNALAGLAGGVGLDPLAEARNNVREAGTVLGSPNLLEAVAADELLAMDEATQALEAEGVGTGPAGLSEGQFMQMVDARAQQLQQVPIQKSDGSVAPMGYDSAIRFAQEQVYNDLRAQGII